MTWLGRIVTWFPIIHLGLILYAIQELIHQPGLASFGFLLICLYWIPPCLFRLYCLRYPSKSGRWLLNAPIRCDWWIAHQLQLVYAALPFLEALLRLVPGLYSVWLRLWGSSIGKRVYWTPLVEILDRHMLSVGDDVVFGHQVCCTSHIIRKKTNGDLVLMVRPTRIEAGVLIGARARIGPGVKIPAKSVVPYNAEYRFAYAE